VIFIIMWHIGQLEQFIFYWFIWIVYSHSVSRSYSLQCYHSIYSMNHWIYNNSRFLLWGHRPNNAWNAIVFPMSGVVTSVDTLLGKTHYSQGLSSKRDNVEVCSRTMEFQRDDLNIFQLFMHVFISSCPWDSLFIHCYQLTTIQTLSRSVLNYKLVIYICRRTSP
jgi:hypothetical protein